MRSCRTERLAAATILPKDEVRPGRRITFRPKPSDVSVPGRLLTSSNCRVRAVVENPGPMAMWGLIVAAGLVLGSIPLFLGLVFVMPVLGHATWHLYRRVVSH